MSDFEVTYMDTAYGWVAVMEEAERLGIKLEYPR